MLQANEVFKLLLGVGETLAGRLLMFDAMSTEFSEVRIWRDPALPGLRRGVALAGRAGRRELEECRHEQRAHPAGAARRRSAARGWRPPAAPCAEVLDDLFASIPRSATRVTEAGELSPFVNVYVNDRDVRYRDGLDTAGRAERHGHPAAGHGRRQDNSVVRSDRGIKLWCRSDVAIVDVTFTNGDSLPGTW